jgi:hypothetical protein
VMVGWIQMMFGIQNNFLFFNFYFLFLKGERGGGLNFNTSSQSHDGWYYLQKKNYFDGRILYRWRYSCSIDFCVRHGCIFLLVTWSHLLIYSGARVCLVLWFVHTLKCTTTPVECWMVCLERWMERWTICREWLEFNAEWFARNGSNGERNAERFAQNDSNGERLKLERFERFGLYFKICISKLSPFIIFIITIYLFINKLCWMIYIIVLWNNFIQTIYVVFLSQQYFISFNMCIN